MKTTTKSRKQEAALLREEEEVETKKYDAAARCLRTIFCHHRSANQHLLDWVCADGNGLSIDEVFRLLGALRGNSNRVGIALELFINAAGAAGVETPDVLVGGFSDPCGSSETLREVAENLNVTPAFLWLILRLSE